MKDIFGQALLDFQADNYTEDITTFSSLDEEDLIPLPYLFRSYGEMPALEQTALRHCQGKILDVGCGAGSHSLWLQENGHEVIGLDRSKGAIAVCKQRGLHHTVHSNILEYRGTSFDTLLLLMNGIGIAGKLENLDTYLSHFKSLLRPGGQILLDSSDIRYMFDEDDDGGIWVPDNGRYYGEVDFKISYKKWEVEPFPWLYLDYHRLQNHALQNGFLCELLEEGAHYDYLAKLTLKAY
ncbi:Methyltransferase [Croceitalea dokdonensis DOKDO 023]|uniref:Methyltransferase n=1 Tax=Croceitalea dokdonensis DOKDO 023 TaxID=1300341 RepID=A0A0N8H3T7_9FLAO|nr:class I SAM-dependent methyltransferase [Croceitalea dokdonensis]KPM31484.1 Methyltransferase [Croceitalea dokdonensis DOKDO 023]